MIGLDDWKRWVDEGYTMLPYVVEHRLTTTGIGSWESLWETASPSSVVLESGKDGRYTVVGVQPEQVLSGKAEQAEVRQPDGERIEGMAGKPLDVIRRWMSRWRAPVVPGLPKLTGGCIGFLGYDVVRSLEKLPVMAVDDSGMPDYWLMRFDRLWILDKEEGVLLISVMTPFPQPDDAGEASSLLPLYKEAVEIAAELKQAWDRFATPATRPTFRAKLYDHLQPRDRLEVDVAAITGVQPHFERDAYVQAVHRIQDYIRSGDVFQVNLSVRGSKPLTAAAEEIYEWLRIINPSPYMALLRAPSFQIVCGSPELLVQLEGRTARTRPIAGTRPRGATPEEDARLAAELLASEKERAEHIMLVDLERNDLGRVSRYGSVQVRELLTVEHYSHVMHLVSEVTSELASEHTAYELIAATFPGGTITGAPKIRTMELIEELEPVRRGVYTGSIGWIDYNGNMELNIVIRTLVVHGGIGYVQAGAGIVIDSDPAKEYTESVNKAKAMWKSIQYAERYPRQAGAGNRSGGNLR